MYAKGIFIIVASYNFCWGLFTVPKLILLNKSTIIVSYYYHITLTWDINKYNYSCFQTSNRVKTRWFELFFTHFVYQSLENTNIIIRYLSSHGLKTLTATTSLSYHLKIIRENDYTTESLEADRNKGRT